VWSSEATERAKAFKRATAAPDGTGLYVAGGVDEPLLARFDWRTGKAEKTFPGHKSRVTWLDVSSDGKLLLSASYMDQRMQVVETETGTVVHSWDLPEKCHHFAVANEAGSLDMWDLPK